MDNNDIDVNLQKEWCFKKKDTLPETNVAPENVGPLEKEIPKLETIHFSGAFAVSFRECSTKNRSNCYHPYPSDYLSL